MLQVQLADCYIDALRDDEIKKEILKAKPEDVARAVHLAKRNQNFVERIRKGRQGQDKLQDKLQDNRERVSRPIRRNPELVSGSRRLEDWSAEADPRQQNWSVWHGFHDSPHKRPGVMCWVCHREGHYAAGCLSRNDTKEGKRERETSRKNEGVLSS